MTPVEKFVRKISKAKLTWDQSGKSYSDWLSFYDKKDEAYQELIDKVPEVTRIADRIWELVNSYPPVALAMEIMMRLKALKEGLPCEDCGTKIKFPAVRCDECARAHEELLKERRELAKKIKIRHRAQRLARARK